MRYKMDNSLLTRWKPSCSRMETVDGGMDIKEWLLREIVRLSIDSYNEYSLVTKKNTNGNVFYAIRCIKEGDTNVYPSH